MKSLINCLLFLTILPSFCMHGPVNPQDFSALEISLKLLRNDSLQIPEWNKAFEALKNYTSKKENNEFSWNLYIYTLKTLLSAPKFDDQIALTPVIVPYKAQKYSLEKNPEKKELNNAKKLLTTLDHPASFFKLLEFSTKVWRVDNNFDQEKWSTIFQKVHTLKKAIDDEVASDKEIVDTVTTMFNESMASNKTIWGDATFTPTPDSQQMDK